MLTKVIQIVLRPLTVPFSGLTHSAHDKATDAYLGYLDGETKDVIDFKDRSVVLMATEYEATYE